MDQLGGAVHAGMELIRGMPGTEDSQDLLCSVSCVYVMDSVLRAISAREKSGGSDAVALSGRFRETITNEFVI